MFFRATDDRYNKLTQIISTFVKKFGDIGPLQLEQLEEGLELHLLVLVEMHCRALNFTEACMRHICASTDDKGATGFFKIVEVMLNLFNQDDKFTANELTPQERIFIFLCRRAAQTQARDHAEIFEALLV
jgi:hypothetical protein